MTAFDLEILDWGRLDFAEAHRRQLTLLAERIQGTAPDRLVLVEHPPVVTIGRSGRLDDLRQTEDLLVSQGVALHHVERGGQATYHGPGQLVAYPIIKLRQRDLHLFVRTLLETAANLLRSYGLEPEMINGRPGLWVKSAKIASMGLAVRQWVTFHGLAMNVGDCLDGFKLIVPCGNPDERITSITEVLGRQVDLMEAKERFIREFCRAFGYHAQVGPEENISRHPPWLIRPAPSQEAVEKLELNLDRRRLATVCRSAHCPNQGECFQRGTATFLILGATCTRRCRFCAVDKGIPSEIDPHEPRRVAQAALELGLSHVVITSVTRDDLPDGGAEQFRLTIEQVRRLSPAASVEVLIPDFQGSVLALNKIIEIRPEVFNHNIETVARLYPLVRPGAEYRRSLRVLEYAAGNGLAVKSGLMLGLGESEAEIETTLLDLKRTGCRHLTIGQYLAPSTEHLPVVRYLSPREFANWDQTARDMGFEGVAAGPLVRSSYRAEEMFMAAEKKN